MASLNLLTVQDHRYKVDWLGAKFTYLENPNFSYTDIARMFGVSLKQVKRHGSNEEWVEGRQQVADLAEQRITETLADKRLKAIERHRVIYSQVIDVLGYQLKVINRDTRQKELKATIEGRELRPRELYSPKQFYALTKALKLATDGERLAWGLPTTISGSSQASATPINPYAGWPKEDLVAEIERLKALVS